jgi:hypothetical protein
MMDLDERRVLICYRVSTRDIDRDALAVLTEGERYVLYCEDMEVEAVAKLVEFPVAWAWLGYPDWTTHRDLM